MHKKGKRDIPQKRKGQLSVLILFTVFLTIGFYLGSMTTAIAKDNEMTNEIERVKKELKRQKSNEDKSPPLKKEQKKSKLAETPEPTVTSKPKPTETPEPTATPKLEPTETPEPAATPKLEPTETPEPTAIPKLEPMETPKPTEAPESTVVPMQEPITVKVIADTKMFRNKEGKRVVKKLKAGESLTVIGNENGLLKVSHNDKEGFVKYIFTDFLDRMGISKPVVISELPDQIATVCKDGVQLRTKPGFGGDTVRTLEYGEKVIIHTEERMFLGEENVYCKITVMNSNEQGYIYDDDSLDWEMEFILSRGISSATEDKSSTEIFEKNFGDDGVTVEVCRPMNLYSGNTTKSKVIAHLQPGKELIVKLCTEANSGWLMAIYNDGPGKVLLGYAQYLNTDYLDKVKQYDSVYKKELNGLKAIINTDSVNLRNRPGITEKSRVVDVRDRGTELLLISYEEVVRYEKHGWYKAIVVDTGKEIYICGKYVDVKEKVKVKKKLELQEDKEEKVATGSSITAEEKSDENVIQETVNNKEKGESVTVEMQVATYFDYKRFLQPAIGKAA